MDRQYPPEDPAVIISLSSPVRYGRVVLFVRQIYVARCFSCSCFLPFRRRETLVPTLDNSLIFQYNTTIVYFNNYYR